MMKYNLKKKLIISLLIIPIIIAGISILFYKNYSKPFLFYPSEKMYYKAVAYCDVNDNGNSTIDKIYNDRLKIDYTLREGPYIYAGFYFVFYQSESLLDLSRFDTVKVELDGLKDHAWFLSFTIKPDKRSKYYKEVLEYKRSIVFDVFDVRDAYDIPIKDIQVEEWMLRKYEILKDVPEELKDVMIVSVFDSTFGLNDRESPGSLEIKKIVFYRKNKMFYIFLGLFVFLFYLIFFIIYIVQNKTLFIQKILKSNKIPIKVKPKLYYSPLNVKNYSSIDFEKIMIYINEHYEDPNISTETIHNEIGIPVYKINNLIKDAYKCSFKKLLNNIRLTEAKRLLKLTDLYVNDILFRVGYSSVVYFNRLFKNVVGISPTEYRRKNKKSRN